MGPWLGPAVGQAFARYFVDTKRDKILSSLPPNEVRFINTDPYGGIIVTGESVILFKARGNEARIALRDVRQAEVNRSIFPAGARYLRVSYTTPTATARYGIGIDRKNGKLALRAINDAAAAAQVSPAPSISYSFGWNAVFTSVAIFFAILFVSLVFFIGPTLATGLALLFAMGIGLLALLA